MQLFYEIYIVIKYEYGNFIVMCEGHFVFYFFSMFIQKFIWSSLLLQGLKRSSVEKTPRREQTMSIPGEYRPCQSPESRPCQSPESRPYQSPESIDHVNPQQKQARYCITKITVRRSEQHKNKWRQKKNNIRKTLNKCIYDLK